MFYMFYLFFFFFKQKTAYELRISDWSSDVCSSDLPLRCWPHGMSDNPNCAMAGVTDYCSPQAFPENPWRLPARLKMAMPQRSGSLPCTKSPAQGLSRDMPVQIGRAHV